MFKKLLIATNNQGKFQEIKDVLADLPINLLNLKDLKIDQDIEETGKTYEENAKIKAEFFANLATLPVVADDSGIQVEALKNELGIHTRRWGKGVNASDQEWLAYFMQIMKSKKNRKACFFSTIVFLDNEKKTYKNFVGKCEGIITKNVESSYLKGIPLSAVFKAEGCNKVYAALSLEEKAQISHRGRAALLLKDYLKKHFI